MEFHHVNWPGRQEAVRLTSVVVGISLGLATFLAVWDFIFSFALKKLILKY